MSKSKNYWNMKQHAYPFQTSVTHMSDQDIDPRLLPQLIGWHNHFLRVPFEGLAHWGFKSRQALDLFKQVGLSRRVQ